jgi:hypothetical protein
MRAEIELRGRVYLVSYTTDVLLPENQEYIDNVSATVMTPRGVRVVTSARILNRICEKLEEGL